MTNPLPSTPTPRPVNAAATANNDARRTALADADADGGTQFDDLLPGRETKEEANGDASLDTPVRGKQGRRSAEDTTAVGAQPSGEVTTPEQPMQMVSMQQVMLTTPVKVDSDETSTENPTADAPVVSSGPASATPEPAKLPVIDPHGPPVIDDGTSEDPSLPTGGIKAPLIDPHGPPITDLDDPIVATADVNDKPPVIRPHGPVNPAPSIREKAAGVDVVSQSHPGADTRMNLAKDTSNDSVAVPAPDAPKEPFATTVPTPTNGAPLPVVPVSVSSMTKGEYTTTIPAPLNPPTGSATPADASLAKDVFPITTAAQAQLATTIVAAAPGAEPVAVSDPGAANLAAWDGRTSDKNVSRVKNASSQNSRGETLTKEPSAGGTSTAKWQASVTTLPSKPDTASERGAASQQDAHAFATSGLPDDRGGESPAGRAKDGNAARISAATASAMPTAPAATMSTPFVDAAGTAPATRIAQVDKLETLLQTVQETVQKTLIDGSGQVELRVRLEGVADEVAVRIRLDQNQQAQVNFQTGSPELRAALEQGWNNLTANAVAAVPRADLNVSNFPAPRPAFADAPEAAPSAPVSYRPSRQTRPGLAAATRGNASARRWSGYA